MTHSFGDSAPIQLLLDGDSSGFDTVCFGIHPAPGRRLALAAHFHHCSIIGDMTADTAIVVITITVIVVEKMKVAPL